MFACCFGEVDKKFKHPLKELFKILIYFGGEWFSVRFFFLPIAFPSFPSPVSLRLLPFFTSSLSFSFYSLLPLPSSLCSFSLIVGKLGSKINRLISLLLPIYYFN